MVKSMFFSFRSFNTLFSALTTGGRRGREVANFCKQSSRLVLLVVGAY